MIAELARLLAAWIRGRRSPRAVGGEEGPLRALLRCWLDDMDVDAPIPYTLSEVAHD
jgi:hypothetical protein